MRVRAWTVNRRDKMRKMSSADFEDVLHPIFEEDELTLIVTGLRFD